MVDAPLEVKNRQAGAVRGVFCTLSVVGAFEYLEGQDEKLGSAVHAAGA